MPLLEIRSLSAPFGEVRSKKSDRAAISHEIPTNLRTPVLLEFALTTDYGTEDPIDVTAPVGAGVDSQAVAEILRL